MKTFSDIRTQLDETLSKDILALVEHQDGQAFRGVGSSNDFGRGGYNDPHHLSGRGQMLDVLIRKVSQLGVENDELAQEVAAKLGLELGESGGVQKLLKMLKCHALGLTHGDLPTEAGKREVHAVAAELAAEDMAAMEERPYAPEASEVTRAPKASRTPPNQTAITIGDPLGYANQGNLRIDEPEETEFDEQAILERMAAMREHYGLADLPPLTEDDLQEDKTDRELKKGLSLWIDDYKITKKAGNRSLTNELRRSIMQVVAKKGLDTQRVLVMMDEGVDPGFSVRISVNEDITPILRMIVDRSQAAQVKFDDKTRMTVDMLTARAMILVHDALKKGGQQKFRDAASSSKAGFMKMSNFALKHTTFKGFKSTGPIRIV